MSNDKKYQVFISSTYTDLIEARQAAINVVLESYNFPVGMEMFGADNDEQWKIIKDAIDVSDFYILILGHRYGSISKEGISYTEKEFDYAISRGLQALCFIRLDEVATKPGERDDDPKLKAKLAKFRKKVTTDRTCEFWSDVQDLNQKITMSLLKAMQRHGGVGWVRGNQQASGQLAEEIATLSEENRKLREENELLKQSIQTKLPVLKLSINEITNLPVNEIDKLELSWVKLSEENFYKKPDKISIPEASSTVQESSELNKRIMVGGMSLPMPSPVQIPKSDAMFIQEYNKDIDLITEKLIEKHNTALRELKQLELANLQLNISVENQGNTIAKQLSIEIEFPKFIKIIDDNSDYDMEAYENDLKESLIPEIKSLERRKREYLSSSLFGGVGIPVPTFPNLNRSYTYTEKNKIYINKDSLLHARSINLTNYYLVPSDIGEGIIKVNIVCAEYLEPQFFEIPISVIE